MYVCVGSKRESVWEKEEGMGGRRVEGMVGRRGEGIYGGEKGEGMWGRRERMCMSALHM